MAALLTFAPGVNPSHPYTVPRDVPLDETGAIKPYVQVVPRSLRGIRVFQCSWIALSKEQWDYFESFFEDVKYGAGVFYWTPMDSVRTPAHRGPDLSQVTLGGAPASSRAYSVRFTWHDNVSGQESKPSPATALTVTSGKVLVVQAPVLPTGVPAIRVYASTTPGAEQLQGFSTVRTWQEPITGLLTGTASPPTTNNLKPLVKCRLVSGLQPQKSGADRFNLQTEFMEVLV
jgi:hypothetical protein